MCLRELKKLEFKALGVGGSRARRDASPRPPIRVVQRRPGRDDVGPAVARGFLRKSKRLSSDLLLLHRVSVWSMEFEGESFQVSDLGQALALHDLTVREAGLLIYPSPLLGPLLEKLPKVFTAELLPRLDPADRAVVAQVGPLWLAAVTSSWPDARWEDRGGAAQARGVCRVRRTAWAKENECPWIARTCALVAESGHVEALQWAREHG